MADGMMKIFMILFFVVFAIVITFFLFVLFKSLSQMKKNNNSPRLTVEAKVVSKRTNYLSSRNSVGTTTYYATFEVASGDRMELVLSGPDYGMLAEGDQGKLTFQGTRFLNFEID